MKKKFVFLSLACVALVFAVTAFAILPFETTQAQDAPSNYAESIAELQATITEMQTSINELTALVNLLVRNQAEQPVAEQANIPQAAPQPETTQAPAPVAIQPVVPAVHTTARLDEAAEVAIARNGGGLLRHICLDREQGVAVYHVRLYHNGNRVDYYLDRATLETVRHRTRHHGNASSSSDSFRRRQMNVAPTLSFNQAADAALAYFGGGTIREVSRSYMGGRGNTAPVFDVDIVTSSGERWCVYVDIHTGEVLRYHRE